MSIADKGIDVRKTGGTLVFRASLKDSTGAKVTTGTTTMMLYELQADGSYKSFDFNDSTFKTTALTTATLAMTHQKGNNGTQNTGVWTAALSSLSGFTLGGIYLVQVNNSGALPTDQEREFQYGGAEGDLTVDSHNNLNANSHDAGGTAITSGAIPAFAAGATGGLPTVDSSGQVKANVTAMAANVLTATAINAGALNGKGDWLLASSYSAPPSTSAIAAAFRTSVLSTTPTPGTVEAALQVIVGDWFTDETTDVTQWHTVCTVGGSGAPGTGYTLLTKKLYDTTGAKLASSTVVVGQASQ